MRACWLQGPLAMCTPHNLEPSSLVRSSTTSSQPPVSGHCDTRVQWSVQHELACTVLMHSVSAQPALILAQRSGQPSLSWLSGHKLLLFVFLIWLNSLLLASPCQWGCLCLCSQLHITAAAWLPSPSLQGPDLHSPGKHQGRAWHRWGVVCAEHLAAAARRRRLPQPPLAAAAARRLLLPAWCSRPPYPPPLPI